MIFSKKSCDRKIDIGLKWNDFVNKDIAKRWLDFIGKVDNKFFSITLIYSLLLFLSYFFTICVFLYLSNLKFNNCKKKIIINRTQIFLKKKGDSFIKSDKNKLLLIYLSKLKIYRYINR